MTVRFWRLATLTVVALSMTMEFAHVLELPQKLKYGAEMYAAVNGTLYRYFAIVGGSVQVASIVFSLLLVWRVRRRGRSLGWTAAGALFLVAAFAAWLAVVEPVNRQVGLALASSPESVPSLWMELRERWEWGHVAGFVLQLAGFIGLLNSALTETPEDFPVYP